LSKASKSLYDLRNTRTNVMTRKLKDIATLDKAEASDILEISTNEDVEDFEE
jgi:DNA recombination protein RmuC